MGAEDDDGEEGDPEEEGHQPPRAGPGPGTVAAARARFLAEAHQTRTRSPSPPRSLFRSTTGKGVAFTEEDVTFLLRFMQYRKWVLLHRTYNSTNFSVGAKGDWTWWPFGKM